MLTEEEEEERSHSRRLCLEHIIHRTSGTALGSRKEVRSCECGSGGFTHTSWTKTALESEDKPFKDDVGVKPEQASVDRVKPAHLDLDQPIRWASSYTFKHAAARPGSFLQRPLCLLEPESGWTIHSGPETLSVVFCFL